MEWSEPEPLGVLDKHHGRVRHVDSHFYHRSRDEELSLPTFEALHNAFLFLAGHAAME